MNIRPLANPKLAADLTFVIRQLQPSTAWKRAAETANSRRRQIRNKRIGQRMLKRLRLAHDHKRDQ